MQPPISEHQVVDPIAAAQAAAATSTSAVGPAVLVALVIIAVWRYSVPGKDAKGTIPGRLLAVVLVMAVCWVLLAVTHPAAAMTVAGGTASGIATLFGAAARIL